MQSLSREEVNMMMQDESIKLVEVLAPEKFSDFHLPNAINVPLSDNFEKDIERALPNKAAPVIVYCHDSDCQASNKAAQKMEEAGYHEVYDYEAGKVDWKAAGLPVES